MKFMRACLILAAINKGSCNICHGRRRLTTAFVSRRLYTNTHDVCLQQSISTSVYDEEEIISTTRQYNINPSVQDRIQNLISHSAVRWDESSSFSSMHRKKLRQRHVHLFDNNNTDDHLFNQFAKAICMAGVVAQKEVFETWASAVYIHASFLSNEGGNDNILSPKRRVVDVAGGHGLLSWALLLLDDEYLHKQSDDALQELTVFCLDVKMPKSAELISEAMLKQWPHLEDRFDYVEGRLEQLIPHNSCLLASVHACGILSDILVATAAKYTIPLAVVPCCHSRKRIVLQHASSYAKDMYDDIINTKGSIPDLADKLDEARIIALDKAGLDVKEVFLPSLFTGKNRLIMGFPRNEAHGEQITNQTLRRRGQMPPLESSSIISKPVFMRGFTIPCKDDIECRRLVSKLAGREAADTRKELMHNRHHEKSPTMDISVWLPADKDVGLSGDALSAIVESKHSVKCSAQKTDQYVNPAGRKSVTFRVQYSGFDNNIVI